MKGRDDSTAWTEPDDVEKITTTVDSKRERRIVAMGPPEQRTSWTAVWVALLLGAGAVAAFVYCMRQPPPPTEAAAAGDPAPAVPATSVAAGASDAGAVTEAPAPVQGDALAPPPPLPPPPPPPPQEPGGVRGAQQGYPILGRAVALGKVSVELEYFWLERDPPGDSAYAALRGYLGNGSDAAMTLPPVDVTLLDNDQREYKPFKGPQSISVSLNPLMRVKGTWAFQVPTGVTLYCAQFKTRDGKAAVRISISERTPKNAELVASDDYALTAAEIAAFASPRVALQTQIAEAEVKLEPLLADLDAAEKRLAKIEKRLKVADDAVDSAKATVGKYVSAYEGAKARLKDLDANRSDFRHNARAQETQASRAEQDMARAENDAVSAAQTLKDKQAARAKVNAEAKEEAVRIKAVKTKIEAQQKVVDGLQKKLGE